MKCTYCYAASVNDHHVWDRTGIFTEQDYAFCCEKHLPLARIFQVGPVMEYVNHNPDGPFTIEDIRKWHVDKKPIR